MNADWKGPLDCPRDKYLRDPAYKALVDMIEHLIHRAEFSPSEIREAAMLACINYEMYTMRSYQIRLPENSAVEIAMETLSAFVGNNKPGTPKT